MSEIQEYWYAFVFIIVSSCLNTVVMYVFITLRHELGFKEILMTSMAVGDLFQGLVGYSLEIYAVTLRSKMETFSLGLTICKVSGFTVTFFALSSILHLVVMAVDRYLSVCKPFISITMHESRVICFFAVFLPWMLALLLAVSPFLGWSKYALEAGNTRCSIDWTSQSLADRMYIVALFVFCFFLPIVVICSSFILVHRELRRMQSRAANLFGANSHATKEMVKAERRNNKMAIILCLIFFMNWTLYALISFWHAFFSHVGQVPNFLFNAAAIIAKSSTITNPIIYSVLHKNFRSYLKRCFICGGCIRITKNRVVAITGGFTNNATIINRGTPSDDGKSAVGIFTVQNCANYYLENKKKESLENSRVNVEVAM